MKTLTVFTPTFNRAYRLPMLYESLVNQTCKEFEWVIVDDGSTDNTKELVLKWQEEDRITIKYYYQKNRGKHIAHNLGVDKSASDLFICVDSDDWLYINAVEIIVGYSAKLKTSRYCGLIGIDTYQDNSVVGNYYPSEMNESTWSELIFNHRIKGDKAIIFKTEVLRKYPFPDNLDKHMPPSYQLFKMSGKYKFLLTNKHLKYVEYLPDGITANIRTKYKSAPYNYMEYRLLIMDVTNKVTVKIKSAIMFNIAKMYTEKKLKQLNIKRECKKYIIGTYPISKLYFWKLNKGE